MQVSNIKKEYQDLLQDVKAFPPGPMKKRAKDKVHEYLKFIKQRYGQDVVDQVAGKQKPVL